MKRRSDRKLKQEEIGSDLFAGIGDALVKLDELVVGATRLAELLQELDALFGV